MRLRERVEKLEHKLYTRQIDEFNLIYILDAKLIREPERYRTIQGILSSNQDKILSWIKENGLELMPNVALMRVEDTGDSIKLECGEGKHILIGITNKLGVK